MGMSTHVRGVRDLDGQFDKMVKVKLACEAAKIPYPKEVTDYFPYASESIEYLKQEMEEIEIDDAVEELQEDGSDIWEIDLARLSKEVKKIRFSNSY